MLFAGFESLMLFIFDFITFLIAQVEIKYLIIQNYWLKQDFYLKRLDLWFSNPSAVQGVSY